MRGIVDILRASVRISRQYQAWLAHNTPSPAALASMREEITRMAHRPTISVLVPVFNTDERWLRQAIDSVRLQIYPHWELCLADDASTVPHVREILEEYHALDERVKVAYRSRRGHIATASNTALSLATGEFVALLDHDDEISPDALYEVVKLLNAHPDADLIYSDEDKIETDGLRTEPFFKPGWSPLLLTNANYVTHFAVLRRTIVEKIGGFRDDFVGSQDYDLFLRFAEQTNRVYHIPKMLYSWRKVPTSAALISDAKAYALDASERALREAVTRRQLDAEVVRGPYAPLLRVRYRVQGRPVVSIVIASSAAERSSRMSDRRLLAKTRYQKTEIIHAPKHATRRESLALGAARATGDFLLFLAGGLKPHQEDWLTAMLEYAQLDGIGCVGAKLLSKGRNIVHAGMALGIGQTAGFPGHGLVDVPHLIFYLNLKDTIREVSAVSAHCMMIRRETFEHAGGFHPEFRETFFDVDLCLHLSRMGLRHVFTPYAQLHTNRRIADENHHPAHPEDKQLLQRRWGNHLMDDPYYNPHFTRDGDDWGLRLPANTR